MKKILIVLLVLVLLAGGALWYFMTYRMDDFIAQQIEEVIVRRSVSGPSQGRLDAPRLE